MQCSILHTLCRDDSDDGCFRSASKDVCAYTSVDPRVTNSGSFKIQYSFSSIEWSTQRLLAFCRKSADVAWIDPNQHYLLIATTIIITVLS